MTARDRLITPFDPDETLEVTFSPTFAVILLVFSACMLVLGIFITLPMAAGQDIPIGIAIAVGSLGGLYGGYYWLNHLPVVLRLTPEGLEVPRKNLTYLWSDIQHVEIKTIYVKGQVNYLCLRLWPECRTRYGDNTKGALAAAMKAIGGNFDLILHEQELSVSVSNLRDWMMPRVEAAKAQRREGAHDSGPGDPHAPSPPAIKTVFAVIEGPEAYRARWRNLQLAAVAGTLLVGAAAVAFYYLHAKRTWSEAFTFPGVGVPIVGCGLYLLAMSRMAAPFFEQETMGQKVQQFVGGHSGEDCPWRCVLAGIICIAAGIGIALASYFTFPYPSRF